MIIDLTKLKETLSHDELRIIDSGLLNRSSVLVPLIEQPEGQWSVLFEVRASQLKRQPGEICFPGGKIDSADTGPLMTARRETQEELGISADQISIWGQLGLIISPYNLLLYSFVGQIPPLEALNPNAQEVGSVFTVELDRLRALVPVTHNVNVHIKPADDFPFDKIPGGRNYPWRNGLLPEVFYEVDGYVIWGLTARILEKFLSILDD